MKKKYIHFLLALPLVVLSISCNDYLDEMPDNRAEIDSEEKISKLLVRAYPENGYILCTELASDNMDSYGTSNPYSNRFIEQLFSWVDVTENDNESPKRIWEGCYLAIANANQALQSIEGMGNPASLNSARGEALLCRAYNHFLLVNVFSQNYSPTHAANDLGIPYMDHPETELNPKYDRGTVAQVYEMIEKDIEEGLPLINNAFYTVPKYHFNRNAANTFASRFYLFYQKWDKVIEYASAALGASPAELCRDYASLMAMPRDLIKVGTQYISTSMKANFLVQTAYSNLGLYFGPYYEGSRYSHGALLAQTETYNQAPWGDYPTSNTNYTFMYKLRPYVYLGTNLDKTLIPRVPYLMQFTDPVAQTGYRRTVYVALSCEEALLNRAEAYVMKEKYTEALADINLWTGNTLNAMYCRTPVLTETSIENWSKKFAYYTPETPTPKKKLNPDFMTIEEGSKQEGFIHSLLFMRRLEFMHVGMRWFDVKRYGIEIYRRTVNGLNVLSAKDDELKIRDNRRAMQLPQDVITAGIAPNPRGN